MMVSKNPSMMLNCLSVKHHPKPQRGEPTVEGHRLVTGMLLVGVWSMGELRTSSSDDEMKIILKGNGWSNGAKLMYKLGSTGTSYKRIYK